jgi:ABC-type uncharacterized transport system ATPase subunit
MVIDFFKDINLTILYLHYYNVNMLSEVHRIRGIVENNVAGNTALLRFFAEIAERSLEM